ncbi:hypothetical protein B0H67DRAFT_659639 [Lasiosphaeris hirsuta]|uniref:Uncharacterized protein n=1 Tax=Lasiosphaeris hirsuta TaxID=260670 RepID=A0AA40B178_9PEZI|nr:hypothetical protein B0H67DRAFT_659639 [Lasiosphaeris hirsuta]
MAPEQRPPNANLTSLFLQLKREREAEHNAMCTVFEAMTKALDQGLSQIPPGKAYERYANPIAQGLQEILHSLAMGQTPKIPGWEALPSLTQSSAPLEPAQHQRATERRPRSPTPRRATANDDTPSEGTPSPPPPRARALGPSTPMSNQKAQAEWETVVAKGHKKVGWASVAAGAANQTKLVDLTHTPTPKAAGKTAKTPRGPRSPKPQPQRLVLKAPEGHPWNKASAGEKGEETSKAIEKAEKVGLSLAKGGDWDSYIVGKVPEKVPTLRGPETAVTELMIRQEAAATTGVMPVKAVKTTHGSWIVSFDTKPKTPFFRVFNSTMACHLEPRRRVPNCMGCFEFHWQRDYMSKPCCGECDLKDTEIGKAWEDAKARADKEAIKWQGLAKAAKEGKIVPLNLNDPVKGIQAPPPRTGEAKPPPSRSLPYEASEVVESVESDIYGVTPPPPPPPQGPTKADKARTPEETRALIRQYQVDMALLKYLLDKATEVHKRFDYQDVPTAD